MNYLSVLFFINVIHGLFIAIILLSNIRKHNVGNIYLALLITIISFYQVKAIIVLEGYYESFPFLINFFMPFHFLIGPLFYLYIKFVADKETRFVKKNYIHFIPTLICFFSFLPFYIMSNEEKLGMYSSPDPENFEIGSQKFIYYLLILISIFFYCWKSWKLIRKKNKNIDGRANKNYQVKLKWLNRYTLVYLAFVCYFLLALVFFVFTNFCLFYVMLSTVFVCSILVHYIAYWTMKESRIINNQNQIIKDDKGIFANKRALDLKHEIINILEFEEFFKKSNLSSNDFCERLNINSQYLSQIINSEFNCNLSYLINSYRIEYAKKIIESGSYSHLNFLGIASMSGFNSANTFTRVFKQHVGITPSQFKKNYNY